MIKVGSPAACVAVLLLSLGTAGCGGCGQAPPTPADPVIGTVTLAPAEVTADGMATATVTVTLRFASDDYPAKDVAVTLRSDRNTTATVDMFAESTGVTDALGRFSTTVKSNTLGTATLSAQIESMPVCLALPLEGCAAASATVKFVEAEPPMTDMPPPPCTLSAAGDVVRLTNSKPHTSYPALLPTSSGFVAVYDEDTGGGMFYGTRRIYFSRFNATGTELGTKVPLTAANQDAFRPAMVATTGGYAVVYTTAVSGGTSEIKLQRLDAMGMPAGSAVTVASGFFTHPALAVQQDRLGVAYTGKASASGKSSTWLKVFDPTGMPVGNTVQVATWTGDFSTYPSIAADASAFAIAWQDRRSGGWGMYFRKVKPNGDFASAELVVREDKKAVAVAPKVAWTGKEFGLAFADTRNAYAQYQVRLARINPEGTKLIADQQLSAAKGIADTPSLTFLAGRYFVSWVEKPWEGNPQPFRLEPDSAAIDMGIDIGLPFNGAAPDSGAVEFGSPWPNDGAPGAIFLAAYEPLKNEVKRVELAPTVGFSAFPTMMVAGTQVTTAWFDTLPEASSPTDERRDLFLRGAQCQ